jgi:hypothetical protein
MSNAVMNERPSHARDRQSPAWLVAAREVLETIDERALTIVVERVFRFSQSVPTLQELGARFGLSRERVRQLESTTRVSLIERSRASAELMTTCDRLREHLGLVFTSRDLEGELGIAIGEGDLPREAQLVLLLAGPYRSVGGTFLSVSLEDALQKATEPTAAGPMELADVRASMRRLGIRDEQHMSLINGLRGVRIFGDQLVQWSGSMADKATIVLALRQRLMTAEEIHEQVGVGSLPTLKNYLGADARFQRRGPHTWGLAEWGGEKYQSIAIEMADELRNLPKGMPVDRLIRLLGQKFSIKAASVEIMSVTHPMFVREASWVRLRDPEEPYLPNASLEEARDCVVIGGRWAWRHLVTHDTLRGSGHIIPEPFAALLRLFPNARLKISSEVGPVLFSWPSQSPGIGSLRRVAEKFSAGEGDYIFLIPIGGRLDFTIVRRGDLDEADSTSELLLRLGQVGADGPWLAAGASAVGLAPHATAAEVDELLESRGDRDVLRLFRSARRGDRDAFT